jgi:hypothetical protein
MADVFVNHTREDSAVAQAIAEALEREGRSVVYERGIGGFTAAQTLAEFENTRCVVWLWSRAAAARVTPEELQQAIRAWSEGRLVLATLDDTALPMGLRDLQGASVRKGPDGIEASELIAEVASVIDRSLKPIMTAPPAEPGVARSRHGAMPLVAVFTVLVTAGMTLSWVVGDLSPRRAGMGMGKSAPAPDFARPQPKFSPKRSTAEVPLPPPPAPLPPRQTAQVPQPGSAPTPPPVTTAPPAGGAPTIPATPPTPSAMPPETNGFSGIQMIVVVLILGVAIGAGSMFGWSLWARRLSPHPTTAPEPAMLSGAADASHLVFVSYSRQDGRAVEDLVREIEQAGYAVWIDRHSTGSQRYAAPIVRAIKTSRLVALMCSQNAFTSDHVIREVYVAGDYKKPFIAFQLDHSEFPDEVQYFVSGFPRLPIEALDKSQLRSELARLVAV